MSMDEIPCVYNIDALIFALHQKKTYSPHQPWPLTHKKGDQLRYFNYISSNCCDLYNYGYVHLHMDKVLI